MGEYTSKLTRDDIVLDINDTSNVLSSQYIYHNYTQTINDIINETSIDSNVLAKLKLTDGSGSGLDLDTLDGFESNSFVTKSSNITISSAAPSSGANKDMWYQPV